MEDRRAPQTLAAQTARVTRQGVTTIWDWAEKRKVAAHVVMAVTLGLTVRVTEWAMDFPYSAVGSYEGTHVAAIQAAVLTPWGLMQGAMMKFYLDLIRSNGNGNDKS